MWIMVSEHGNCYHLAKDNFVSLCGRNNLYIGGYVELIDGVVRRVGEGGAIFGEVSEYHTCKICLDIVKKNKI